MREGVEYLRSPGDPWWASAVPDLRHLRDVPMPYSDGLEFTAPVIDMSVYLPYLAERVEGLGGTITRMALPALPTHAEVVVNATGLGARMIAADASVMPIRGQIARLSQVGIDRWSLDAGESPWSFLASTTSWWEAPRRRAIGIAPRLRKPPSRCCAELPNWSPSWCEPRCSSTGWGCDLPGQRSGWSVRRTSCTAMAMEVLASRCRGAVPRRSPSSSTIRRFGMTDQALDASCPRS